MFCDASLAGRIDQAEARLMIAIAQAGPARDASLQPFVVPIGVGAAIYAGPGSPSNKMIGIGFDEAVDPAVLDDIEARFASRQASLQAEVSVLASPELHSQLVSRGYAPASFEHVLGHPLGKGVTAPPDGVHLEMVQAADVPLLGDVLIGAFASPDIGGVGGDLTPYADDEIRRYFAITMSVDGFRGYFARVDGEIAGGGAMRIDGDVAQFCGAGTLPRFRRRGVQTALYRARLADARDAGCSVAVVVTQPGSKSQQNAQREGFSLLYARQLLIKSASPAA